MMPDFLKRLVCGLGVVVLALLAAGCDPAKIAGKPAAGPPPPPAAPVAPPPAAAGVVMADAGVIDSGVVDSGAAAVAVAEPVGDAAGQLPPSTPVEPLLPTLTADEAAVHAMFRENMAAARSTDGKFILAHCNPNRRSEVIIGMAQMGYSLLGPDSEVGRMVASAGLLAAKYQPMFDDLKDHQIDSPENQTLLDEAAGKIRDPERLVSLVREASVPRMPEAKYELVALTIEGDQAAGVCLMVTYFGTQPNPFAAEKIDGQWYAAQPTPAAQAKVAEYEANPTPATVELPPRKQVRVAAEQLAAEFQSNPSGAAEKYGSPFGPSGPIGPMGPPGPYGDPHGPRPGASGIIVRPPTPPQPRDHDIVLEATVAYRMSIHDRPVVYLVTPAGLPAINMSAHNDKELAARLAAAEPGQTVRAFVDAAMLISGPMGEQPTISVSSSQFQIRGEAAEPFGPMEAADFFRELSDPAAVAKYQGRPIILTGSAVMSQPQALMLGLSNGQAGMVGCALQAAERKRLQAVKQGQSLRVQGTYIQPSGRNQIMLHGTSFVAE